LQKWGFRRGADTVALAVDQVKLRLFAPDLTAQEKGALEVNAIFFEPRPI
jgi:hypothetical protein